MKKLFCTTILSFWAVFMLTGALFVPDKAELGLAKNYITNGGIERGTVGFATYKNTAQATPVSGTGGSPTHITIAKTTSSPLKDSQSLNIVNSGSTSAQGEGASYDFTIDAADQASVINVSFDYSLVSGTFQSGSISSGSVTDSDIEVYVYDKTNSALIQPSGYILTCGSVVGAFCTNPSIQFQSAVNSTSYRLIWHVATTNTSAWTMKVDNIVASRQSKQYGSPITDWVNLGTNTIHGTGEYTFTITSASVSTTAVYSNNSQNFTVTTTSGTVTSLATFGTGAPTSSGTLTCVSGCSGNLTFSAVSTSLPTKGTVAVDNIWGRRVGGNYEFRIEYRQTAAGANGAGDMLFGIPDPYRIDLSKVTQYLTAPGTSFPPASNYIGGAQAINSGSSAGEGGVLVYDASHVRLFVYNGTTNAPVSGSFFGLGATSESLTAFFSVPISGLSSNVQMSDSANTRVVSAMMNGNAPLASAGAPIIMPSTSWDTHAAYNATTGRYTAPVSGYYRVTAYINTEGGTAGLVHNVYKNASQVLVLGVTNSAGTMTSSSAIVQANSGDLIDVRSSGSATNPDSASWWSIDYINGPATITATESVNMSYTDTSGTSITTSPAAWVFHTKVYDSHNSYSGSTYTVPIAGKYRVSATITTAAVVYSTTNTLTVTVEQNGVQQFIGPLAYGSGTTITPSTTVTGTLNCLVGDTIQVFVKSGASTTGSTTAGTNLLSIERVGN